MRRISLLIPIVFILASCKSTDNLVIQHDTIYKSKIEYKTKFVKDSIIIKDSTSRYVKDSIIYIETFKYKDRLQTVHDTLKLHDTCYIENIQTEERVVYKDKPKNRAPTIIFTTFILVSLLLLLYKKYKNKFKI